MVLGALIVLFYTTMGGFLAVAWTDFVQGIIMIFTCVALPLIGWFALGGGDRLLPELQKIPDVLSMTGGEHGAQAVIGVIGGLSWGLGYMGQPHLLMRYMAIRSPDDVRKSTLIAAFWAVPAFWGAFLIGIVGLAHYGPNGFADPERLMPTMAQDLLPAWLAGIMISGAIAAMMSTADSQLLVTTSTLSEDVYCGLFHQDASSERLAQISRAATLLIGVIAFALGATSQEQVFDMVSYAWSGLAAAFAPALLLTLWWKRTTGNGVLAGMVGGTIAVVVWKATGLEAILTTRVSGVVLATFLVVGVSLLDPGPPTRPGENPS
jgi:sodium/proline symporter